MNQPLAADLRRCVAAALLAVLAHPARADLNNVPNLTVVQAPVARVIQQICPGLGTRVTQQAATAQQTQLFTECRKMVQTSNQQQGSTSTPFTLGLSEAQLRDAVQGVAPEELNAQAQRSTSNGRNAVNGRLLALRSGARGFQLSGNRPESGEVMALGRGRADDSRGGGAGTTPLTGPWGGFVNVNYNKGDRNRTAYENAFDFTDAGLTAGADYRVSQDLVLGGGVSYDRADADFEASTGSVEAQSSGVLFYGSYSAEAGYYMEGHLGYTRIDYNSVRKIVVPSFTGVAGINTSAGGSTKGTQSTAALGAGYDLKLGKAMLVPFLRLEYLRNDIDGFTETDNLSSLGLDVNEQTMKSLQTSLGVRYSIVRSSATGVWAPYLGVEWTHEFKNDSRNILAKYTHDPFNTFFAIPTEAPDRNFATLSLGVSAQFFGGLSGFLNFDSVQGLRDTSNTGLTFGLRQEF